jgi:hypothetical protein
LTTDWTLIREAAARQLAAARQTRQDPDSDFSLGDVDDGLFFPVDEDYLHDNDVAFDMFMHQLTMGMRPWGEKAAEWLQNRIYRSYNRHVVSLAWCESEAAEALPRAEQSVRDGVIIKPRLKRASETTAVPPEKAARTEWSLEDLEEAGVPEKLIRSLAVEQHGRLGSKTEVAEALRERLSGPPSEWCRYQQLILKSTKGYLPL